MAQASFEDIRETLLGILEASAVDHKIDIVDVEVVGSTKAPTVRVRIDHEDQDADPISLDEVSEQTGWISDIVDEADPIEGRYMLEVSSPGVARPLRKKRDFERFAGEDVSLTLRKAEGRRRYSGRLEGYVDDKVHIVTDEGPFFFSIDEIRTCSIKPNYDAIAKNAKANGKRDGR